MRWWVVLVWNRSCRTPKRCCAKCNPRTSDWRRISSGSPTCCPPESASPSTKPSMICASVDLMRLTSGLFHLEFLEDMLGFGDAELRRVLEHLQLFSLFECCSSGGGYCGGVRFCACRTRARRRGAGILHAWLMYWWWGRRASRRGRSRTRIEGTKAAQSCILIIKDGDVSIR